MKHQKKQNVPHKKTILKGFVANKKVNKDFECDGFKLKTNHRGGLIEMTPRIDDLYYQFYGQPIELVLEEFPAALSKWYENN